MALSQLFVGSIPNHPNYALRRRTPQLCTGYGRHALCIDHFVGVNNVLDGIGIVCTGFGAFRHLVKAVSVWRHVLSAINVTSSVLAFFSLRSLIRGGFGRLGRLGKSLRRKRQRERRAVTHSVSMVHFSVVTFNVRAIMDRWPERHPILKACLEQMSPDVVAFQEVLTGKLPDRQLSMNGRL